jgi:endonuclease/exonuclease/phosphatase family metal-dependent hydrolase
MQVTKTLSSKNNKPIINFYNENYINDVVYDKQGNDNILICSYNVHGWVNIDDSIDNHKNFYNILDLLTKCKADIIVLQEVCLQGGFDEEVIFEHFRQLGYMDYAIAQNGGCFLNRFASDYIMIFSKKMLENSQILKSKPFIFTRNCILVEYANTKILLVHLEIGKRYHHLDFNSPTRKKFIDRNVDMRTDQLREFLKTNPDIIVGDFNFGLDEFELGWVQKNGFEYCGNLINTTPYNRTDMVFTKKDKGIRHINSVTIKCNYSDHLPILCELKIPNIVS